MFVRIPDLKPANFDLYFTFKVAAFNECLLVAIMRVKGLRCNYLLKGEEVVNCLGYSSGSRTYCIQSDVPWLIHGLVKWLIGFTVFQPF